MKVLGLNFFITKKMNTLQHRKHVGMGVQGYFAGYEVTSRRLQGVVELTVFCQNHSDEGLQALFRQSDETRR